MRYVSKGMVIKQSTEQQLRVTHCGVDHILTGIGASLWLNGRLGIHETKDAREVRHLQELQRLGLVEIAEGAGPLPVYRLLTRCVICPAKLKPARMPLTRMESRVWRWISKAGLRLTIGELTKLITGDILPTSALLGKENAQDLTLLLYAGDLTFDTSPDLQMESSPERDSVVRAVMGLLRKKQIILI